MCVRERWLKGAFVHFSVWSLWPLTSCLFVKWSSKHWPHTRSHLLYVEPTVCWPSSRFIFKQNRPRSWTSLVEDLKTNWILLKTIIFLSVYGFANTFTAEKTELLQVHEWHNNICCPIWAWPNQIGPVPVPCRLMLSAWWRRSGPYLWLNWTPAGGAPASAAFSSAALQERRSTSPLDRTFYTAAVRIPELLPARETHMLL